MEATEFAGASIQKKGSEIVVSHGNDSGLLVQFYLEAELQGAESEKMGRSIYRDVPYIWIRFPGDRNRETRRRVRPIGAGNDTERFPSQWASFQNKQEIPQEGTAIEEWGPISKSMALNYRGINIHTVEHLAAVPDSILSQMGHGARDLRDKAIAWLKASEGDAELLALQKKTTDQEADIEMLKQQIAELANAAVEKPKRGRPKGS